MLHTFTQPVILLNYSCTTRFSHFVFMSFLHPSLCSMLLPPGFPLLMLMHPLHPGVRLRITPYFLLIEALLSCCNYSYPSSLSLIICSRVRSSRFTLDFISVLLIQGMGPMVILHFVNSIFPQSLLPFLLILL